MAYLMDYGDDWRDGYVDVVKLVAQRGTVRPSRIGPTMEIRDFVFTLSPEAIDLPLGTGRRLSTSLAAAEAIQLCAGFGMPALTEAAASQVAAYVRDPDGTVHGNYGSRVGLQIVDVVEKLQHDPSSRQAVVQIWNKQLDSSYRDPMPKDIPCTLTLTFGVDKSGALTMSVVMRSSDVWLGLPFDVFQFRQLQRTIAWLLGREIGQYCHHSVSMHAYDHDLAKIGGLAVEVQPRIPSVMPTGIHPPHAADLMPCMIRVLAGVESEMGDPSHAWYNAALGSAYHQTMQQTP